MANEYLTPSTADSEKNEDEKKKKRFLLLWLLILAFAAPLAWMFFDRANKVAEYNELSERSSIVQKHYDSIQISYNSVMSKLDSMVSENFSLQNLILEKKKELKALNERLRITILNSQNDQAAAQSELETLRDKIASLSFDLQRTVLQRDSLTRMASSTTFVYDTVYLRDTVTIFQPNKVAPVLAESTLSLKKLTVTPASFNSKKQASSMDLELVLQKDNPDNVRPEQLFLVVKNEALKVLKGNTAKDNTSTTKTEPAEYSGIIYTRADTVRVSTVTYRFTPSQPIPAGNYVVELYHSGKKIGEKKTTIRTNVRPYPF